MAITYTKLVAATKAAAEAVFAKKSAAAKYVLPTEALGMITEMINEDNPLAAYSSDLTVKPLSGSVDVKYDVYNDNWAAKTTKGSDVTGGDDQIIDDENFRWNASLKKEESLSAADIKRGTPNILANRMVQSGKKFIQASIKEGFKSLVEHTVVSQTSTAAIGALSFATRDAISQFKIKLLQEVTKFAIANEIAEGDVTITLNPLVFDALAENGMIGDRATQTFATGQFGVGTIGGYKVQSGGMYIPSTDGQATPADVHAFVGTAKTSLHSIDYVAANAGKLGLSNDEGTYLEMADIHGDLDYKGKFGKVQGLVITA